MTRECIFCSQEVSIDDTRCPNCGNFISSEPTVPTENSRTESVVKWYVRCPIDGYEIVVEGPDSRIDYCPICVDEFDRTEISHERPYSVTLDASAPAHFSDEAVEDEFLPECILTDISTDEKITIKKSGVIGRICGNIAPEIFKRETVGDPQCRIILEERKWFVEHLGRTNPTKVNGSELSRRIRMPLCDGDYLTVADLIFEVRIPAG